MRQDSSNDSVCGRTAKQENPNQFVEGLLKEEKPMQRSLFF